MKPPTTVHVAYCQVTGVPQYADTKARAPKHYSCTECDSPESPGTGTCMAVARYQLAPHKERTGRKPRRTRRA